MERKQGIEDIYKEAEKLKKQYGTDYEAMSAALEGWYKTLPVNHPARNHSHYSCIDEVGIYFPSDISWPGGGGPKYEVLHSVTKKPVRVPNRGWVYPSKERMDEVIAQGLVHFGKDETSVPCKKHICLITKYLHHIVFFIKADDLQLNVYVLCWARAFSKIPKM